ncbi:hypothetical protein EMCRGX_G023414 [Ephydatia muelleri]
MAEKYVVRFINLAAGSPSSSARQISEVRYPPESADAPGVVVTTELQLWEVMHIGGFLSFSYWKSFFSHTAQYSIILNQQDPISSEATAFVLHESDSLADSQDAFERLRDTFEPLVGDCNVVLTKELLALVVLPEPVEPSNLPLHLLNAMRLHPEAHRDWFRVVQSLALSALRNDDHENLDALSGQVDGARVTDRYGNGALHLASSAKTARHILHRAGSEEEKKKLLSRTNGKGKTALEVALEECKAGVVGVLLEYGARLPLMATALHVAAEKMHTSALLAAFKRRAGFCITSAADEESRLPLGGALNSLNEKGLTPLMISALHQHLDGLTVFLQAGADPNIRQSPSGFTAMHYAAQVGAHDIIKCLIAFEADVHIGDRDGRTPLDVARTSGEAAKECVRVLEETTEVLAQAAQQLSEPSEPVSLAPDALVLLSMDGGGSRGLLTCQTIAAIQNRMRQLNPRCSPLYKYCHYIAGTSTGGLIGLSMAFGASLGATRATFFKVAKEVFGAMRPTFAGDLVDETTQETFGLEKRITDVVVPRLIVTTVLADRNPSVLHLLCNYGEARNGQKPPHEWKVWEVGRATSAAPVYFPQFDSKFIDGGVMANNPTLDAMVEIFNHAGRQGETAKIGLVVSIGTGIVPSSKVDNVGVLVPNIHNVRDSIPALLKTFSGLSHLLQLFIGQCTRSDGEEVERARAWCRTAGAAYVRLSCPLREVIDLAESDTRILTDLMYQGTLYNLRRAKDIDTIARCLLSRPEH